MDKKQPRLIILAWDGACFEILNPLVEASLLPGVQQLKEEGIVSVLKVNLNDYGWPTILTGLDASETGAFYYRRKSGRYRAVGDFSAKMLGERTLLELPSRAGFTVGSININFTFPCPEINGFVVAGGGGGAGEQPTDKNFTYPVDLKEKNSDILDGYVIDFRLKGHEHLTPEQFMQELLDVTERRIEVMKALMERYPCDMFLLGFHGFDRFQHWLWDFIPKTSKNIRESGPVGRLIINYFQMVDNFLVQLLNQYPRSNLMVVSDHGFCRLNKKVYINEILAQNGYFKKKKGVSFLYPILSKAKNYFFPRKKMDMILGDMGSDMVFCANWRETLAYGDRYWGVNINLAGREPMGIVRPGSDYERLRDKIIELLSSVKDPETGNKVFLNPLRREELYQGRQIEYAPDIIFDIADGYETHPNVNVKGARDGFSSTIPKQLQTNRIPTIRTGIHTNRAIFLVRGAKHLVEEHPRIIDILPTALMCLGIQPSPQLPGKCIVVW